MKSKASEPVPGAPVLKPTSPRAKEKKNKKTIQVRYWKAGMLLVSWMSLVIAAFYCGLVLGRIQEGQDRIVKLKELERWAASGERTPLTFYEELEKEGHTDDKKLIPSHVANDVPKGEQASKGTASEQKVVVVQSAEQAHSSPASSSYVQVASFKEKAKAESVAITMQNQGHHTRVSAVDLKDKGTWFRVEVGPFSSNEELQATRARLQRENPTLFSRTPQ